MRRIKETYLLLLIVIGLFSLSIYSTYALFTEEYTVGMLNVNTSSYNFDLSEISQYKHIDTYAGETQTVTLNLLNSTGNNLYYGIYTDNTSSCITFDYDTNYSSIRDIIENNVSKTILIEVNNICENNKAIKLYTITSTVPLDNVDTYPDGKTILTKNKEIIDNTEIPTIEEEENIDNTTTNTPVVTYLTNLYEKETPIPVTTPNQDNLSIIPTIGLLKDSFGNIRYYGQNPNNYINFNDELWRIIGIFETEDKDGALEKRVKIIRNESLGLYPFDNKPNTYGSSISDTGSNNWLDSRLMMLLNPDYDTEQLDTNENIIYEDYTSLYWNRKSGLCYNSSDNTSTSCDFSTTGLNDTSKTLIEQVKYYLSGTDTVIDLYSNDYYDLERKDNTKTWVGYIGLMYPSDFAYASDPSICTTTINNYSDPNCNNWLSDTTNGTWTLTPSTSSSDIILSISKNNSLDNTTIANSTNNNVKPVTYLKSEVTINSGDGTKNNPYIISLGE